MYRFGYPESAMFELLTSAEMAEAVAERHPSGSRIAVVAGPGNNGGEGFVAARLLAERGARVEVMLLSDIGRLKGDAAMAAKSWTGPVPAAEPRAWPGADVVIDALFGAGLDR